MERFKKFMPLVITLLIILMTVGFYYYGKSEHKKRFPDYYSEDGCIGGLK